MHDYHEGLPGYSEAQILHDGCGECEARSKAPGLGISQLDKGRFVLAWQRAAEWNRGGLLDLSRAERPMLDALWAVQIKLENRGIEIGKVPTGAREWEYSDPERGASGDTAGNHTDSDHD